LKPSEIIWSVDELSPIEGVTKFATGWWEYVPQLQFARRDKLGFVAKTCGLLFYSR
jgi:hypothetical protein